MNYLRTGVKGDQITAILLPADLAAFDDHKLKKTHSLHKTAVVGQ